MPHVAVVIGGGELDPGAVAALPADVVVIAADSGLDHAVAAGLRPAVLVGDMDSISAAGRMWAYAHEVDTHEVSADKDLTDTELALALAVQVDDVDQVTVLGGTGDRLDHLLGTLLALGSPSLALLDGLTAFLGDTQFAVVHAGRQAAVKVGEGGTFSVLALHGAASGVTVRGARWELDDADLGGTEARGVSNEAKEDWVVVSTKQGVVTVVVPS